MAKLSYNIEDFTHAKAFVVKKNGESVATFYYDDQSVPKEIIHRGVKIFCKQMNDLITKKNKVS